MKKLVSFMHVSLDGFVAGPKGEMNWIKVDEEIFDHAAQRTHVSDTALYGRKTYELMEGYWPTAADRPKASRHDKEHSAWYNKVHKIVISRSMKDHKAPNTTFIGSGVAEEINKIKNQDGGEIIMFGSPSIIHLLTREGLIDDYWLFVNPVLIGKGIPMFKDNDKTIKLRLVESKPFSSGVVCLHYTLDQ